MIDVAIKNKEEGETKLKIKSGRATTNKGKQSLRRILEIAGRSHKVSKWEVCRKGLEWIQPTQYSEKGLTSSL